MQIFASILFGILIALPCLTLRGESHSEFQGYRRYSTLRADTEIGRVACQDIAVRQDGLIVFATARGALLYDGERWKLFEHPDNLNCISIGINQLGHIFVGFNSDFGRLDIHEDGEIVFTSLRELLISSGDRVESCSQVLTDGNKVYFGCSNGIGVWDEETNVADNCFIPLPESRRALSYWMAGGRLNMAIADPSTALQIFELHRKDFVRIASSKDGTIEPIYVVGGCDFSENEQLVASFSGGLWKQTESGFEPFEGEVNDFAKSALVKGVCALGGDRFVLSSEKGVVFFRKDGSISDRILTEESADLGICRNRPIVDHENQLWIPTRGMGIAIRIDLATECRQGHARILDLAWTFQHRQRFWIGGTGSVQSSTDSVEGTDAVNLKIAQSIDALPIQDDLLISTTIGLVLWNKENGFQHIAERTYFSCGAVSPNETFLFWGCFGKGIALFRKTEGQWALEGYLNSVPKECFDLKFDPKRKCLWFTSRVDQSRWSLGKISIDESKPLQSSEVTQYPDQIAAAHFSTVIWNDQLLFNSSNGLVRYDDETNTFLPASLPFLQRERAPEIGAMAVDRLDQLWIAIHGEGLYRVDRDGKTDAPCYVSKNELIIRILSFPEADEVSVMVDGKSFLRIPIRRLDSIPSPPPQVISLTPTVGLELVSPKEFIAKKGPIQFQFASQSKSLHPKEKYQYRLLGYDDQWSSWTSDSQQSFQALKGGDYTFQVRAQSNLLEIGPLRSISFFVPPSWHETWWARSLAGFSMLLSGLAIATWRSRQLRIRARQLEAKIQLRTAELADAKRDLEFRVQTRTEDLLVSNQKLQSEIEQRKTAECRLQESEIRYRTIVEGQSEMIVRFDTKGLVTFANGAYCRQYVKDPEKVLGQNFYESMGPSLPSIAQQLLEGNAEGPFPTIRHRTGNADKTVWEDWTIGVIEDGVGRKIGFQAVGRDVTALVETQEALRQKEDYVRHASRLSMLGEMVASITHELRQPLGSISNFAFASEKSLAGEESKTSQQLANWNHQIVEQIARADTIVRRLRGFARRADAEIENCDVNAIVLDTISMLEFELRRSEVNVETRLTCEKKSIHWVRVQLEQVLVNLIRNACDAMTTLPPKDRRIQITTSIDAHMILVTVRDTGIGMSDAQLSHLFEPFQSTKKDGLGLGLAISRSIIEDGGGKIWATRESPGTSFSFTLVDIPENIS